MGLATVDLRNSSGDFIEYEMVHCRHCRAGIPKRLYPDQEKTPGHLLRVEKAQGGLCYRCGGPICLRCVAAGTCVPYMKQVEELHNRIQKALGRDALAEALALQGR
jgi:hypothetical protein